ncbi:hypothetical protein ACFU96_21655 [Streptomyces sp. NPDC057620]|uniref:DUF6197 family protein n=1 Tax=Streptomyces sp. NPDC057620 TaxID=3346185 RepID=UPI0036CDEBD6
MHDFTVGTASNHSPEPPRATAASRLLTDSTPAAIVRAGLTRHPRHTVLHHLQGTLHTLRTRGWAQGEYLTGTGAVCLRQAVEEARTTGHGAAGTDTVTAWTLRLMVHTTTRGTSHDLTAWNDTPGRTEGEALQLVEDAIRYVRDGEGDAA